ncbi:MAG: TonB-dependent receptor [Tannerellaceae bacterium]|nr:TonB-dependent receptor [Tannerellaceae bacterium]
MKKINIRKHVKHLIRMSMIILFLCAATMTYASDDITKLSVNAVQQQGNTISGTIVDASGEAIIGVNVIVTGTTNGTITDLDGKFTLTNVPANATLNVSYIGYMEQTISVQGRSRFNIVMAEDIQNLEEVVVVGYGVQKKVNLTGSVATVKYDKELENRPITNASQALAGKMPGVWVSQNSGAPGDDGAQIRVRGWGTMNNTDPLILIDGIEGRIAEINPSDIESITVLKDAASAAIYGSRAANGVVLIETKKGGDSERISLNYNGYVGVQQLSRRYETITDSPEYMRLWNTAYVNSGGSPLFPDNVIEAFENGNDPYKYPSTNYFDEVFRDAVTTQHNLSLTAGGKSSNSYISLSYRDQDGIVRNTSADRVSLAINNTTTVNKYLTVGARANLSRRKQHQPYGGIGRFIYMMSNGHPFSTPYLQDGKTYGGTQALYLDGEKAGQPIVDTRNPFPDLYNGVNNYTTNFLKGNVFATVNFMKGLTLTAQYSGQYTGTLRDRYNEEHYCYTDLDGNNQTKPLDFPSTLLIIRNQTDEYSSTFFANMNFDRTFAEIHEISAVAGMQMESMTFKFLDGQKSDPPKGSLHQVSSGTANAITNGNTRQLRMLSYFGRVNYALMSKYLFEVNVRADASSRFAKGNRWGYFPSLSAAWRLGEESFIKNLGVFDNLKLRASWGKLGNQNLGSGSTLDYFPYLPPITQSYATSYNFAGQLAPGAAITQLVDPAITWETTTTTDIGLDLGFLNNRLSLEMDYFDRKTTDIIVRLPLSATLGSVTAPFENIGEMKNTGFEINAIWQDRIQASDFAYSIGANFTLVNNGVTKFQGGKSPDDLYLIREGYSFRTLYGFIAEGVYQSKGEAAQHMPNNGYIPAPGDLRYQDFNGDGKLDYQDKREIGNTLPKYTFGITGNLSWKGFDLSFLFSGIAGVNGYYGNTWTYPLNISGGSITERWRNAWTPENPSTELPRIVQNDTWNRQQSSFWACNMSFFKLKNLQVGYTVPKAFTNKLALQNLYVYVNGTELFTLVSDKYEGFDPERDLARDGYELYPTPRVFSFGLNVTF